MEEKEIERILLDGASELGVILPENSIGLFRTYLKELLAWNRKINLTSITSEREVIIRHFLDSLTLHRFLKELGAKSLLDIGSGAGFPGIPLKIADPGLQVTLMDSVEKKVHFMRHMIRTLGLKDIEAIASRAEEKAAVERLKERFDCVTSRALISLDRFLDLALPYCRAGGSVIAIKGPGVRKELEELKGPEGIEPPRLNEIKLPFTEITTTLVIIKKKSPL